MKYVKFKSIPAPGNGPCDLTHVGTGRVIIVKEVTGVVEESQTVAWLCAEHALTLC